ncbi:MAG: hypothetical protein HC921_03225 [Synechococcaceae cyanobacterium SM2_3_1]|nr:hypothetical protein [Synechococcaceae cyanobacterium SM2_3_1]
MFIILSVLMTACGSAVPKAIVKQALTYRIAHPSSRPLVGYEQLQQQIQLLEVQVRRDQTEDILLTDNTALSAHHLQGTYDVQIQPSPSRHYQRNHLPFQLTLAAPDPEATEWILLEPVPRTDPQQWRSIFFLPPAPPPEPEDTPVPEASAEPVTDQDEELPQDLGENDDPPAAMSAPAAPEEIPSPTPSELPPSLSEGNG